jgi:hypothetical protein
MPSLLVSYNTPLPQFSRPCVGAKQVVHDGADASPSDGSGRRGNCTRVTATSRLSFYVDGAHTAESLLACAEWFADSASPIEGETVEEVEHTQRVLLFNCMQVRIVCAAGWHEECTAITTMPLWPVKGVTGHSTIDQTCRKGSL